MLTVVVDSFDGYSDLWECFFSVFKKKWEDCPYEVKLISNYKKFDGIETINTGEEINWSYRTLSAIKQIESKYILLLLEDYLLGERVNNSEIEKALNFMEDKNANYLRLTNIPKSRNNKGDIFFPLYQDEEYAVNLQASIWKREFLIESLEKYPGNAWEFEIGFLKKAVNANHGLMENCYGMSYDPLCIHNGVLKGKWFPSEIKYFSKQGIYVQWENRGKLSYFQLLKYKLTVALKNRMSYKMRKKVKRLLKKCGMKFVSDL